MGNGRQGIRIRYRLWFTLLLLGGPFRLLINAQPSNLDSLWQHLMQSPANSTEELQLHTELANYWIYYNLDSTAQHINYVLSHPEVDSLLPPPFSHHFLIKGWQHQGGGELLKAKAYMQEAYRRAQLGSDFEQELEVRMNLGSVLTELRDSSAWDFAQLMINEVDSSRSQAEREAWIIAHQYQIRLLEAQGCEQEALERLLMLKESAALRQAPSYVNGIYNSLGVVLGKIGDYKRALFYHREALALPGLYPYEYNDHLLKLAEGFYDMRRYDSCGHYLRQVTIGTSDLYPPERWLYYYNRARLAFQQEQIDTSLYYMDLAKTLQAQLQSPQGRLRTHLTEAEILAKLERWPEVRSLLPELQAELNAHPERWSLRNRTSLAGLVVEARLTDLVDTSYLAQFKAYEQLQRELATYLSDEELKSVIAKYELVQKEQENRLMAERLGAQIEAVRAQRWIMGLIGLLLLVGLALAYYYWRNWRTSRAYSELLSREKVRLAEENQELLFVQEELTEINEGLQAKLLLLQKENGESQMLEITTIDKVHQVSVADIMYLCAEDEGTRYYLADGRQLWSKLALRDALEAIEDNGFFQVFRSVVVNQQHIDWVNHSSLRMKDGSEHRVGRSFKSEVKRRYAK